MQEWVRLPTELLHTNLKRSAILVIAVLIDRESDHHQVTITVDDMATKTGLSRRSVLYALQELRAAGYITDTIRSGRASTYTLRPMLEPKRRRQRSDTTKGDISKYESIINKFPSERS